MEGTAAEVKRLLGAGVGVDLRDKDQFTPLHFAAMYAQAENARALLEAGADVDARDRWGNTPLAKALTYHPQPEQTKQMVRLLREHGADPYCENNYGNSPISTAYTVANYDWHLFFADLRRPEEHSER